MPDPTQTAPAPASTADVHALLELPGILTERQARGADCVWDEAPLTTLTAIDLGERQAGDGTGMWPRGCKLCVLQRAMTALQTHTQTCGQCAVNFTNCPTGHGLVRLTREARR